MLRSNSSDHYSLPIIAVIALTVVSTLIWPAVGHAGTIRHAEDVVCMDFSPDGSQLMTVDGTTVKVWDTTTSTLLSSLEWRALLDREIRAVPYRLSYYGEVTACSFEPAVVVVSHYHGVVSAFDWSQPQLLMYFNKSGAEWLSRVEQVVLSKDRRHVVFVADVNRGKDLDHLYSLESGQRIFDDALIASIRKELSRAPDLSARLDGARGLVEVLSKSSGGRPIQQFPLKRGRHVWAFSPDDSVFGFSEGPVVQLWDLETGSNLQKARMIELEKAANEQGVKIRYGFQEGSIGTRHVPVVTNTRYLADTYIYVGDQPFTIVTTETQRTGGEIEDVQGVTAVFGVQNQSAQDFIVDLWIEATVTRSSWKRFHTFWTHRQERELVVETSPLAVSKRFLLKAGESIRDQIVVGEERPEDFKVYLAGMQPVDEGWIAGLEQALAAEARAANAEVLAAQVEAYLADDRARGYRSRLIARQEQLSAYGTEPVTGVNADPGDAFSIRLEVGEDYDPLFLSEVTIVATNRLATEVEALVRGPEGKLHSIQVPGNGESRKTLEIQVERDELSATLERLVENVLLIDETFSDSSGGWHEEETKERSFGVRDGAYRVENRASGFGSWAGVNHRVPLDLEHDFTIELALIKGSGRDNSRYAFFWASEGWSVEQTVLNGYEIRLDPWEDFDELNGFFCKVRFGNCVVYSDITLKTDLDRQEIKIRRAGDRVLVTINGHPIDDAPFEGFFGEYLGFLVTNVLQIGVDHIRVVQQKPLFVRQGTE